MLRRSLFSALALAMVLASPLAAADAPGDALLGKWWFPEKNGKMEVTKDKDTGKYVGVVVAYDDVEALDKNNPDESLRTRKFIGITMLEGFTYEADDEQWAGGTIYDGDSGKTYKCKMWFKDGDPNILNVRGFIGVSILGRTELFTRVTKEDEEKEAAEAAKKEKQEEPGEKKPE